ncbi:alpha/beta fold hydrolase [Mycobacterium asiaticum]|uniref:Alpha/beta hydrolase n=1 Tax=Mycobacterium asiaticum TaxID=1790 RepID=A0A1A3UCU6_MYCAS|nr:alpha/beta hydrolase [Mycobacterium asiaticum]OBK23019.1 alpha/beta hydrolase [Mycobacterium asiaticum]OBK92788.1 alpha/beta hydrolase [Mycobacterium asiaticum]
MTAALHVHRFGPPGPPQVLALHGLTGHGQRWQHFADYVPEIALAAPDLIGHGRSTWAAPWTIEANVSALSALLEDEAQAPVHVIGHSFGGALGLHLAAARPDLVASLLLLDPAIGLDGSWMAQIAEAMLANPDYPDRAEARQEKASGSWADVDPTALDADLDEHLIALPNGRYGWRISLPAMMSYWSELARDIALPPAGVPTTLVRAKWTSPPYVGERLITGLRDRLGDDFELLDYECDHMVPHAKPDDVAALIRKRCRWRR